MALPNEIHPFLVTGNAGNQYKIPYSLRFRGSNSAYLTRYTGVSGTTTKWTVSLWTKRGSLGSNYALFGSASGVSPVQVYFMSSPTDCLRWYENGGDYQTTQLFRDVNAWYHLVFVYDSTQATASNRMKIYVNGSQVTSFSTQTTISLNAASNWNGNYQQGIGVAWNTSSAAFGYYDGYIAEFNNIDGQALDATYFGYTDNLTNQWVPKKYTGTYGTNGYYLPFNNTTPALGGNLTVYSEDLTNATWTKDRSSISSNAIAAPNGGTTADKIVEDTTASNTHRAFFNNLTLTNAVTYTFSVYAKAGERTAFALEAWNGSTANYCYADLSTGTVISGSHASSVVTNVGNGWYRCSVTNTGAGLGGSGSAFYLMNSATAGAMSYTGNGSSGAYFWGSQVEAASSPGPYYGTVASAISQTYLIGQDQQNGSSFNTSYNNWPSSNFSLYSPANTTTYLHDSYIDSPTTYDDGSSYYNRGNYPTLNPISSPVNTIYTVSNGNLTYYCPASSGNGGRMTIAATYGLGTAKYYWEVYPTDTNGGFGLVGYYNQALDPVATANPGNTLYVLCFSGSQGTNNITLTYTGTTFSYAANDLIGLAYDGTAGTLAFYKNGTLIGTYSGISTSYLLFPGQCANASAAATNFSINFGQRPFRYTPPAGYVAINSYNLANPSLPLV